MASSLVYSFPDNYSVVDMITEAFERCGVFGPVLGANHLVSAARSLNLVFSELASQELNQWTTDQQVLELNLGQADYQLPPGTVDVLTCYRRASVRQLGGTPASSAGGTAANAFDGDDATACTQTSANGNISYDWGTGNSRAISMVGIVSETQQNYTLVVETSTDATTWNTALTIPRQAYAANVVSWFVVPAAIENRYIRVRETGGATLNINELYFNTQTQDIMMGRLTREQYFTMPDKTSRGTPTSFYVDRQVAPVLRTWQPTDGSVTQLFYVRIRNVQSITNYTQTVDAPFYFLEAITAMLAARLATKFARDRLQDLQALADKNLSLAKSEDRDRAPTTFRPDCSGWGVH